MKYLMITWRPVTIFLSLLILVFGYQNCGQEFSLSSTMDLDGADQPLIVGEPPEEEMEITDQELSVQYAATNTSGSACVHDGLQITSNKITGWSLNLCDGNPKGQILYLYGEGQNPAYGPDNGYYRFDGCAVLESRGLRYECYPKQTVTVRVNGQSYTGKFGFNIQPAHNIFSRVTINHFFSLPVDTWSNRNSSGSKTYVERGRTITFTQMSQPSQPAQPAPAPKLGVDFSRVLYGSPQSTFSAYRDRVYARAHNAKYGRTKYCIRHQSQRSTLCSNPASNPNFHTMTRRNGWSNFRSAVYSYFSNRVLRTVSRGAYEFVIYDPDTQQTARKTVVVNR